MAIYMKTEEKSQYWTKFISLGFQINVVILFLALLIYSFYCIWMGNLNTSTWHLPYNLYVPFDTSIIYLWYFFWLIQFYVAMSYSMTITCSTTYFLSCCFYLVALCEHFHSLIKSFDSIFKWNQINSKRNEPKKQSKTKINSTLKMNEIIKMHYTIHE